MSRNLMLIVLGVIIAVSPFSGLPMRILAWILPVLGLLAVAIGVSYRRRVIVPTHEASLSSSS